jgi:hypothetical protein
MDKPFTVFLQGKIIGGYVTFWKTEKTYMCQCDGIGKPKKCSKALYEEAKKMYLGKENALSEV